VPIPPTIWKLTLSYDGTPFHGWQVQPRRSTIQGTLAAAINRVTGESVLPQGSGRTDAGVHALGQVASFQLRVPIPPANLHHALNRALPPSIRVLAAERMPDSFHARHSALRKTYEYRIFERRLPAAEDQSHSNPERICSPFLASFVWDCPWVLQLEPMQTAAELLLGTHNFTSFAASDPDASQRAAAEAMDRPAASQPGPNPVKTLFTCTITRADGQLLFRVTGTGFLHHMVRNLVGTLVEIGRGTLQPVDISTILASQDRTAAGPTAPAQGLFLVHVDYPLNPGTPCPDAGTREPLTTEVPA
jgi:tRNA pseudouridine38-40 synthase